MDNSSSNATLDLIPPLNQRLGASVSYFILALIGTTIYLTLLAAICKGRHKLGNHTFYLFVYSFAVADIGEIAFTNFVVSVPLSFTGRPLYGNGALIRVLSFSDSFFYYAILSLVVLMALNRFLVFYSKSLCKKLFERPNVYITLIIPWTAGFILDGCQYLMCGCIKTYDETQFHFYYECSSDDSIQSVVYSYIDKVVNLGLPFFSLFLYLATFMKMKFMLSGVGPGGEERSMVERRNKREKAFLVQALIICLILGIESCLFYTVPVLAENNMMDWYWVSVLLGWAVILNSSVNPIVYFCFNTTLRQLVLELFGRKSENDMLAAMNLNRSKTGSEHHAPVGVQALANNFNGRRVTIDLHR